MKRRRHSKWREVIRGRAGVCSLRMICALILCFGMPLFGHTEMAHAATTVHMSSVVGFNGYYAKDHWTPVNLTVVNNGPTVNAEIVVNVDFSMGDRFAQGNLRWPVQLPAHESTSKQISVPGTMIDQAKVDCVVDGRVVSSSKLSGTALGTVSLVTVLSKDAQIARVLTGVSDGAGGNPVLPVTLSPANLPSSANLLNGLRAIMVEPDTIATSLTTQQRAALLTWVKLGGTLIVAGTDRVPGWGNVLPILPGPGVTEKGSKLASYLADSVTPPSDFQASGKGVTAGAEVWAGTEGDPLIAELTLGRGMVVQTGFQPTQPSLVSWSSDAALWTKLLQQASPGGASALPNLLSPDGALQLVTASDALSPLKIPSLTFWASVFLVYGACMGPLLFFLLRKWKSEPLAWFILPTLSIVTTIGIYLFGANQRPPGILTEGVGVLDLVGDGTAESYGIRGFMSPVVTSGFASTDQPMLALPLEQHNVRELGTASVLYRKDTTVSFNDVGRWGVRYIYTAGAVQKQGNLDAELWGGQSTLTGRITNNTRYPLHNVAVFWDDQMITLGDLKPGESVGLNRATKTQSVSDSGNLSTYSSYNRDILHGIGRPLGTLAAKAHLFDLPAEGNASVDTAMVIATTDSPTPGLPEFVTGQAVAEAQSVVLVRQFEPVSVYPNSEVTAE